MKYFLAILAVCLVAIGYQAGQRSIKQKYFVAVCQTQGDIVRVTMCETRDDQKSYEYAKQKFGY